jgi:hypothetical protein
LLENVLKTKILETRLNNTTTTQDTITEIIERDMKDKETIIGIRVTVIDIMAKEIGLIETIETGETINIEEEGLLLHVHGHTVGNVAIAVNIAPSLDQEAMTADMARQAIAGVTTKEITEIVTGIGRNLEEGE